MVVHPLEGLLSDDRIPAGHYVRSVMPGHSMVPHIEFFLSLSGVPGFAEKYDEFFCRQQAVADGYSVAPQVQWANICVELVAIRLLGGTLGLRICEFPAAQSTAPTCDVVALLNGVRTSFEVKNCGIEEVRQAPKRLLASLGSFVCEGYHITAIDLPRAGAKKVFYPASIALLREQIETKVQEEVCEYQEIGLPQPETLVIDIDTPEVKVFLSRHVTMHGANVLTLYAPLQVSRICTELTGKHSKNDESLIAKAERKGAHYLMYGIPAWESFESILDTCFTNVQHCQGVGSKTDDAVLQNIDGVILFARHDWFRVLTSLRVSDRSWIPTELRPASC
ncbi:hypothetical protein LP414_22885 [Polaromonas sp. P1(28)-13]|nr:hypothetical protein LP414_22885 [Polaromonas sp. P1(28)-13]